jgi:hypothetical protein
MISEKTVELNLTTEFINWLSHQHNTSYFAVGPTQAQEAKWGFDAGIFGKATGALIQYKRAYVTGTVWEWKLNRTKSKDQLDKLQKLELAGHPVFFAFPNFHTLGEVQAHRRRLLTKTFWYRPSQINPAGGPIGHHEVRYDSATKKWTVHSDDPVELPPPASLGEVIEQIDNSNNSLSALAEAFNIIVLGDNEPSIDNEREEESASILSGVCLVGKAEA